ncbi:hypothetical protein LIER_07802 [Lithospermum erythrorhizon]|uniref:RNase H type-1 domain-containing protein n=1 Tax=Lithospermum erythrorhizon TaxID=34254 RepID=A0AAV3P9B6_LITER
MYEWWRLVSRLLGTEGEDGDVEQLACVICTVKEGLELARMYGWYNIKVESDFQILIKSIVGEYSVPLEIDIIVEDIRCQGRLLDAIFRYVMRRSNTAAHLIAHWNCGLEKEATWLQSPPHWLIATLLSDCTSEVVYTNIVLSFVLFNDIIRLVKFFFINI